jgi:hypothetical protein
VLMHYVYEYVYVYAYVDDSIYDHDCGCVVNDVYMRAVLMIARVSY